MADATLPNCCTSLPMANPRRFGAPRSKCSVPSAQGTADRAS